MNSLNKNNCATASKLKYKLFKLVNEKILNVYKILYKINNI
jgi:hypothetical protein